MKIITLLKKRKCIQRGQKKGKSVLKGVLTAEGIGGNG